MSPTPGVGNSALVSLRDRNERPAPVKVLVLAQIPPPLHGQSAMVQAMLEGLRDAPDCELHHVNLALSRDHAEIGRWRGAKVFRVLTAAGRAVTWRFRAGCDTLYYVPAPAKRAALYRDWAVMLVCRPFFRHLVLHWHAGGLGEWLHESALPPERFLSHLLLGRADLSIVLGENLRADAGCLQPRRIVVVRNGIADPCPGFVRPPRAANAPLQAIFVGLCSREKGVLTAAAGVLEANRRAPAGRRPLLHLTAAGAFPDPATEREFHALAAQSAGSIRHAGFVTGAAKHALFAGADVLIFPTAHPAETQGLVVAEALAFDLPVIVTRWRAVHEGLPADHVRFVEPNHPDQIADALEAVGSAPTSTGVLRAHFLAHLTLPRHLAQLRAALVSSAPATHD